MFFTMSVYPEDVCIGMGQVPSRLMVYPREIIFNPIYNKVYVADENERVQVLNSDLEYSSLFGKYGGGADNGEFDFPYGVACDTTGNLYVSNCRNYRIQVFTAERKYFGKEEVNWTNLSWTLMIEFILVTAIIVPLCSPSFC